MAKFGESRYAKGEQYETVTAAELAEEQTVFDLIGCKPFNHSEFGRSWIFTLSIDGELRNMFMSQGQIADRDDLAEDIMQGSTFEEVAIRKVGRAYIFCSPEELSSPIEDVLPSEMKPSKMQYSKSSNKK